jgi:hypothetical protein
VEFFKDETSRRCRHCGEKVINPKMDFACAVHCRFAEKCLGELPPELLAQRNDLLKDRVAIEMKRYFHRDFEKIRHASRVARYAEELVHEEKGDHAVVLIAAYLHDLGRYPAVTDDRKQAAEDHGGSDVAAARQILEDLGAARDLTRAVCHIIGHLKQPRVDEGINFKIVHDADLIAQLDEEQNKTSKSDEDKPVGGERSFMTKAGGELARRLLAKGNVKDGETDYA